MLIIRSIAPLILAALSITSLVLGGEVAALEDYAAAVKPRSCRIPMARGLKGNGLTIVRAREAGGPKPPVTTFDLPIGPGYPVSDDLTAAGDHSSLSEKDSSLKNPLVRSLDPEAYLGYNMSNLASSVFHSTSLVKYPTSLKLDTWTETISSTNILYIYQTPELEINIESAIYTLGDTTTVCNTTYTTTMTTTISALSTITQIEYSGGATSTVLSTYTVSDTASFFATIITPGPTITQTVYYTATSTKLQNIASTVTDTIISHPTYV